MLSYICVFVCAWYFQHPSAVIGENCLIGPDVILGPECVIEEGTCVCVFDCRVLACLFPSFMDCETVVQLFFVIILPFSHLSDSLNYPLSVVVINSTSYYPVPSAHA